MQLLCIKKLPFLKCHSWPNDTWRPLSWTFMKTPSLCLKILPVNVSISFIKTNISDFFFTLTIICCLFIYFFPLNIACVIYCWVSKKHLYQKYFCIFKMGDGRWVFALGANCWDAPRFRGWRGIAGAHRSCVCSWTALGCGSGWGRTRTDRRNRRLRLRKRPLLLPRRSTGPGQRGSRRGGRSWARWETPNGTGLTTPPWSLSPWNKNTDPSLVPTLRSANAGDSDRGR